MSPSDRPPESESAKETVAAPSSGEAAVAQRAAEDGVGAVWSPGEVILGLYEVKGLLGEGGMGTVYQVHHRGWNTDLAVKSPKPEELAKAGGAENFVREAEAWVNLGLHPHVVSCYYVRTLGGIPRVFAEYVAGGSLATWIRERKLYEGGRERALERILDIAIQFAWGLEYAHEQGLIHQDVKPANVMMAPDGTVKVTDFGLARARGRAPAPGEAKPGGGTLMAASGGMTPAYASPEQARGQTLTRRTDIWSWGVSLLEMFTGEVTWLAGQAAAEALQGYLEAGAEDAELPKMPPPIAELLARCFLEDPQKRPQGMGEVAKELQASYEQLTKSPHARPEPRAPELTADSLNNRALSLIDLGKEQEAEAAWLSALQSDAQHPDSTYNRGLMRWRRGEITDDQLVQQLEEVRKTHGDTWQIKYLLALVHMERADVDAARPLLEEAKREAPSEPGLQQSLDLLNSDKIVPGRCLRTFEGHTAEVDSIHLSQDGRHAISAGRDGTLLWEVASGAPVRTPNKWFFCLSQDGRYALSAGSKTLAVWEVASGRLVCTLEGHSGEIHCACFSEDGRYALSGGADKTLRLWGVETGRCLRTFEGHTDWIGSLCMSQRYALSGGGDRTLRLWDLASGRCLRTLEGHTDWVLCVHLSSDGRYALSGGGMGGSDRNPRTGDKSVRIWDVASGRCLRKLEGHTAAVYSVCFSPDARFAISGGWDRTLRVWEVASGRCLRTLEGHTDVVRAIRLSSDGRYALSGGLDKTLRLWQCPDGTSSQMQLSRQWSFFETSEADTKVQGLLQRAKNSMGEGRWSTALGILREARSLPGKVRAPRVLDAWDKLSLSCRRTSPRAVWLERVFAGHAGAVSSVCLSVNEPYALSAGEDKTIRVWNLATGQCLRTLERHGDDGFSLFSPDGRYALSGSKDETLRLWEVSSGSDLGTIPGAGVSPVCLSPDGRYVLSRLQLREVASGRSLREFRGEDTAAVCACFSPDGRFVLAAEESWALRLWEVASGLCQRVFEGHRHQVQSVCFSLDGRFVLSGGWDKKLRFWEVASGRCLRTFKGHTEVVNSVCLTPDGRFALSGSRDRTVRIWDVASGRCLHTLEGYTGPVQAVCLSRDGRYVLSGGDDRVLRLWRIDWEIEANDSTDWDDGAQPLLEIFLTQHAPYEARLPQDREPQEKEIQAALTHRGKPSWIEEDFKSLLGTLSYFGYGRISPQAVKEQLLHMTKEWKGPVPLAPLS